MFEENLDRLEEQNEEASGGEFSPSPPEEKITAAQYFDEMFEIPKKEKEKRGVKRAALAAGITFLVFTFLNIILNYGSFFLIKGIGKNVFDAYEVITEPAIQQIMQIVFSIMLFTVPFIVVYKLFRYRISDLLSFKMPEKGVKLPLFLFGIGFCAFANIASSIAASIFERAGIKYSVDFGDNPEGFFGFLLCLISTSLVPALVEEYACRGILLGSLKKYGDGFAVIASAALFGLMHGNFEQIPFAFLVGLGLGYITVKSGSILIAIGVHSFNNLISVIYDYILADLSSITKNLSYCVFLVVCMILGLAGLILFTKREQKLELSPSKTESSLKEKMKYFFTSVPIIIYIVLVLINSVQFFIF